jgi:pectinesterase
MQSLIFLLGFLTTTILAATSPPNGALVVGPNAQYKTLQSAITAASPGAKIFINPGTYHEQVHIPPEKKNLVIIGHSEKPNHYNGNRVTITQGLAQDKGKSNEHTATLRAWGDGLKVYNVNFVNSRGQGSQALALAANGNQMGFYGCQFRGFQDTVMSERGRHIFGKSLIVGATDFIFGMYGIAWFEECEIKVVKANLGYVTANGRDKASNPSYFVINNSEISGDAPPGSYYLGRPWREFSRVVVQHTKLGAVINKAGWHEWNKGDARTSNVYYGEYKNSGPGAVGPRVGFAKSLGNPVSMRSVLGGTDWVDSKYIRRED